MKYKTFTSFFLQLALFLYFTHVFRNIFLNPLMNYLSMYLVYLLYCMY